MKVIIVTDGIIVLLCVTIMSLMVVKVNANHDQALGLYTTPRGIPISLIAWNGIPYKWDFIRSVNGQPASKLDKPPVISVSMDANGCEYNELLHGFYAQLLG